MSHTQWSMHPHPHTLTQPWLAAGQKVMLQHDSVHIATYVCSMHVCPSISGCRSLYLRSGPSPNYFKGVLHTASEPTPPHPLLSTSTVNENELLPSTLALPMCPHPHPKKAKKRGEADRLLLSPSHSGCILSSPGWDKPRTDVHHAAT